MAELQEMLKKYAYAYAIWTDRADFITDTTQSADLCTEKLLEIRCFDSTGEYRAFRSTPSAAFREREITDDAVYCDGYFDEKQYLDIDTTKSDLQSGNITATGGGKYHLPANAVGNTMLIVRYYYCYDEDNGIARKRDWRLVGFGNPKD